MVNNYLRPEGVDPASWTEFRRQQSSTDRPIDHVAPEEIDERHGGAVPGVGPGMRGKELLTQAAAVFGYKRRTPSDDTRPLEAALEGGPCTAAASPSSRTAC